MLSQEQIKHVAKLSKLSYTDDELDNFVPEFGRIIDMVEQLQEVDTTGVPVTTHVTDARNIMREDVAVPGTDRDLMMRNVPQQQDGLIKVPAIIDESEEG